MLPVLKRCQQRQILGLKLPGTRTKHISHLPFIDKNSVLRLANDQLGAVLDFVAVALKTVHHRVGGIICPLDDVNKFTEELIQKAHRLSP